MDDEVKQTLNRIYELTAQNNRILRSMKREILIMRIVHVLYWLIIGILALVGYLYIQPYIADILVLLNKVNTFLPR